MRVKPDAESDKRIRAWLRQYGRSYRETVGGYTGYNDCDMIDSCLHDLFSLTDDAARARVTAHAEDWIAAH